MRNQFYRLGTLLDGGAVYYYTGLGEFRSAAAAVERCRERGALVFRQADLGYGFTIPIVVAVCTGRLS